jgi:DNA-directed RNA polymerase subunit RPC12/RpoP
MNGRVIEPESGRLDGNAAAGILSEIFAGDMTAARATCVGCGASDDVGALLLYAPEMGAVLRCPGCGSVVLRVARTPTQLWLDATGSKCIVVAVKPTNR